MATAEEQRQARKAKQTAQQKMITGTAVGVTTDFMKQQIEKDLLAQGGANASAVKAISAGEFLGTIINVVGQIGLGLTSFFSAKKAAKKRERLTKKQEEVREGIDSILATIEETGLALIDQGAVPNTQDFENKLYKLLINSVGYRGNCNAVLWVPGSKPGPGRQYYYTITGNGRNFKAGPGLPTKLPGIETEWYVKCSNLKDVWTNAYQRKLVSEGRMRELDQFQQSLTKGKWTLRLAMGSVIGIMMLVFAINALRIK